MGFSDGNTFQPTPSALSIFLESRASFDEPQIDP